MRWLLGRLLGAECHLPSRPRDAEMHADGAFRAGRPGSSHVGFHEASCRRLKFSPSLLSRATMAIEEETLSRRKAYTNTHAA